MRWNCPHCATALAVSDDKLGAGWNFSRCYKCGQFSMVRKAEAAAANAATAEPPLAAATTTIEETPTSAPAAVEPALELTSTPAPTPPAPNLDMALPTMMSSEAVRHFEELSAKIEAANMPGPAAAVDLSPANFSAAVTTGDLARARNTRGRNLRIAMASAAIVAIFSGTYLFSQGRQLWEKARAGAQLDADRIRLGSAAPKAPPIVADSADLPYERKPAVEVQMIQAPPTAPITLSDEVQKSAMAPIREEAPATNLTVRVTGTNVALRSGPGTIYPAVALGDTTLRYRVLSWKGPWFRIGIPARDGIAGEKVAWIRNDFIELNTSGEITE